MLNRTNAVTQTEERWRPPLFVQPTGFVSRTAAAMRRFLDLQAGSIWRDMKQILPQISGAVLDVGCGSQPYRPLLGPAARYIGIDTQDSKAHFGYEVPGTRYFNEDVWPIEDTSVDCVLCTEALEHVPVPDVLLAEARRCLRPGGTLLLTVPFAARWHFIPYDYWRFTPSGLYRLLHAQGFEQIAVYPRGNAVTVACYKAMALLLPLLLPPPGGRLRRIALQVASIPFLPALLGLAIVANVSLAGDGGDDCLGYTAVARKRTE